MKKSSDKIINVTFLLPQIIMGGVEKVLLQYIIGLQKNGITPVVISKTKVTDQYFLDFFRDHNIKLIDDICLFRDPHFFLKKWLNRIGLVCKLKLLLLHSDFVIDFANCFFSRYIKHIKKPKVGWCHGSILVFDMMVNLYHLNLEIYDKIVCLTKSCQDEAVKNYPMFKDKLLHIYNPIDLSRTEHGSATTDKNPYFIAVQRLHTEKDVKTIIDAFNIFYKKHPEYKMLVVGNGPQWQELTKYAENNDHIIFTGQVDNPYPLIAGAKALVLSSTMNVGEGLPNILLEAQILKTLAISSDVPSGPHEILLDGKAGILFKPGDSTELAKIFVNVASNKYNTKQIIDNATNALNRFDADTNVNKLLDLIHKTLKF